MVSPVSYLFNSLSDSVAATRAEIENTLNKSVLPATEVVQKSDAAKWAVDLTVTVQGKTLSLAKLYTISQQLNANPNVTIDYNAVSPYADPSDPTSSSPYLKAEDGPINMIDLHNNIKTKTNVKNYPAPSGSALDKFLSEVADFIGVVQKTEEGVLLPYPVIRIAVGKYDMPSDLTSASAGIAVVARTTKGTNSPVSDKLWLFGYIKLTAGLKSGASCSAKLTPGFAVYDGEMMSYGGWLPNAFAVSVSNGGQVWLEAFVSL